MQSRPEANSNETCDMEIAFHYPPELMYLLIDAIPLLCRSKTDVIVFFQGAGVPNALWADLEQQVRDSRESIRKSEITRTILVRLNEKGEATLRERREVLKRVTEFEAFSSCWPKDQLKAKGLVAEIRRVIDVKDAFTRMKEEREAERRQRQAEHQVRINEVQRRQVAVDAVKSDFYALFREMDTQKRGKLLEGVLNRLFALDEMLVYEALTRRGTEGEGIVEQIDGVVKVDGQLYLVEMKWWNRPLGPGEVSPHLVRLFSRSDIRGIFISASGYTEAALGNCRDALQQRVVVLCTLEEIVRLLERGGDLQQWLRTKINAALVDRNPWLEVL
jgi:hypothetical protein